MKRIRQDFPFFPQQIRRKPIIYLDSACTTLMPIQVMKSLEEYYRQYHSCAERSIHTLSNQVAEKCANSRQKIRNFLHAKNDNEIIFTKNATEWINLVAPGLNLKPNDVVLMTDKEHNSNLVP